MESIRNKISQGVELVVEKSLSFESQSKITVIGRLTLQRQ